MTREKDDPADVATPLEVVAALILFMWFVYFVSVVNDKAVKSPPAVPGAGSDLPDDKKPTGNIERDASSPASDNH